MIAGGIRRSDRCARTGRDELGEVSLVLTATARPSDAVIVAVRPLLALAAPYHVRGEDRTVGRGIGVASWPIASAASRGTRSARRPPERFRTEVTHGSYRVPRRRPRRRLHRAL